ncbi:hypothetical protein AAG906_017347 [Vitis piasezkii]
MWTIKYDIEKFNDINDFRLWKMKALLLDNDLLENVMEKERREFQRKAYSWIILSLSNQVLRKISHEKTFATVWKKLKELYNTRALLNLNYLKDYLYGFKTEKSKPIDDALDEFNKLVLDLESLDIMVEDEIRDAITFDDVQNALNAKVLDMKSSEKINNGERKSSSKSKSKDKKNYRNVKCYYCNNIRRIYLDRQEEEKTQAQGSVAIIDDGYDSAEVLLGNNMSYSVVGIGTMAINMFDGMTRTLESAMVVMKGQKRNGLYILEGHTSKVLVGSVLRTETNKTILWHKRLGHLSDRGLKGLHKQGLLCGDNISKIVFINVVFLASNTGIKEDSKNRSLTLDKDHFEFEVELSSQDGHDQQKNLAHGGLEIEDTERNIKPSNRFGFAYLIAYESIKWLTSMTKEFESL